MLMCHVGSQVYKQATYLLGGLYITNDTVKSLFYNVNKIQFVVPQIVKKLREQEIKIETVLTYIAGSIALQHY